MQLVRMIAPKWLGKPVIEGVYSDEDIANHNGFGYNIYFWPNHPKRHVPGTPVDGTQIDTFNYVFVDYDVKSNTYESKEAFIEAVGTFELEPTRIVDSGGGIHVYWRVSDLDAMSYLRLQRRLVRRLNTDEATCNLAQLMRLPGTMNTKIQDNPRPCEVLYETENTYTCEQLDKALPAILAKDEEFAQQHYMKTHHPNREFVEADHAIPPKFGALITNSPEAKELWAGTSSDRSKGDYRLGHLMFANGFTRDEARSVLVNSAKALQRAPIHRLNYADNIINKIWTFEESPVVVELSESIASILKKPLDIIQGTPLRCHKRIDNTDRGFRLGDVIGLVAGTGVGKTSFSLNMFKWFLEQNPDYHHFFVSLEQPSNEIAERWETITQGNSALNDRVHVLSNYDDEGNHRNLSLSEIQTYLSDWQTRTGNKIGCVVIDHIAVLKKKGSDNENQDLMTICHSMKAFAVQLKVVLVMQSQAPRAKAGIGDLELDKDAAYGTATFEWYCSYLITIWQPLKRCHSEESCPLVTAFKFCKIRHKKPKKDVIKEDVCYYFRFDSETEQFYNMTQDDKTSFDYYLSQANNKRNEDVKTKLVEYVSVPYEEAGKFESAVDSSGYARRH